MRALLLLAAAASTAAFATVGVGKGCQAVPIDKCGTDWFDSCLVCGTASDYDCTKCCPGCSLESKSGYSYCDCKSPGPGPGPTPPGGDTWDTYKVAGMDVTSVTGGKAGTPYSKVVIMLHGGGGSGKDWEYQYQQGWLGNITGFKYVFPTTALAGNVWYISFKNGCGFGFEREHSSCAIHSLLPAPKAHLPARRFLTLVVSAQLLQAHHLVLRCGLLDDCAYNISSIGESASRVAALIEHEKGLVGGDASKVFLAGFSEGAQMTGEGSAEVDPTL